MAQRKRTGPIIQNSVDRNYALLQTRIVLVCSRIFQCIWCLVRSAVILCEPLTLGLKVPRSTDWANPASFNRRHWRFSVWWFHQLKNKTIYSYFCFIIFAGMKSQGCRAVQGAAFRSQSGSPGAGSSPFSDMWSIDLSWCGARLFTIFISVITMVYYAHPSIPWCNGSTSDSRSEGCMFESRRGHINHMCVSESIAAEEGFFV